MEEEKEVEKKEDMVEGEQVEEVKEKTDKKAKRPRKGQLLTSHGQMRVRALRPPEYLLLSHATEKDGINYWLPKSCTPTAEQTRTSYALALLVRLLIVRTPVKLV